MTDRKTPILVFGATGQQGGSVATALLKAGWPVRALVRDPASAKSAILRDRGVELVQGTFADTHLIRFAMRDVYGVFSVQPSSGQGPELGISDEDEVSFGKAVADLAVEAEVVHLVYSSGAAVSDKPTRIGHFNSKAQIEAHVRSLPIAATIIRPAAFMEMLVMPGFGLDEGRFNFFPRLEQSMQLLAVDDIGKFVAAIFADTSRFRGETFDIASDSVTGSNLEAAFTEAAGRPIPYARFSDTVLAENPFLDKLTALMDEGPLAGDANLEVLRTINPEMQTFRSWLAGSGREAFQEALGTAGKWAYGTSDG